MIPQPGLPEGVLTSSNVECLQVGAPQRFPRHVLPVPPALYRGSPNDPVVYDPDAGTYFFSQKTRPWNFGACILWILSIFIDFRVPPTTPWSMSLPQALSLLLKKHAPGFVEHVSCGFCLYMEFFLVGVTLGSF